MTEEVLVKKNMGNEERTVGTVLGVAFIVPAAVFGG